MFTISRQCLYLMPCTLAQDEERCKYYFQNLFFPGFHEIFQVVLVEMQDAIDNNAEYNDVIIDKLKTAVDLLNLSHLYVRMIDRLLSGDYGDDSFLSNLDKELTDLNDKNNRK